MRFLTRNAQQIALALLMIFFVVSLKLTIDDSVTFDETAHISAAYSYVSERDYRLNPEHPPLLKVLAGLPLLALNLNFDTSEDFWTKTGVDYPGEYGQWSAGRHLLYEAGNDTDKIVFWSRLPLVLVATAFGWLLFVWARQLAGALGGLLALTLYVLSPNILGHGHYVTTDVGIAAIIGSAFFFFIRYLKKPSWPNALWAGVFLGLAQTTKFSAIMLYPIFGILALLYPLFVRRADKITKHPACPSIITQYLRSFCMFAVSLVVVWFVYAPFTVNMPPQVLDTLAVSKITDTTKTRDAVFRSFILKANQNSFTRPLAMYAQGLIQVFHRVEGGNGAYFFGVVSSDANPLYFPTVFLIKETLPHLTLMIIAAIIALAIVVKRAASSLKKGLKQTAQQLLVYLVYHPTQYILLAFITLYAYISITGNLTIGYRHLFPIVPLLYLLTAVTLARAIRRFNRNKCRCGRSLAVAVGILLTLLVVDVVRAYPHYLSYFNQSVGGPENGYRYVTDSNADWGQDLKRLKKWIKRYNARCSGEGAKIIHRDCLSATGSYEPSNYRPVPIDKIRVDYFGGDNPELRLGDIYVRWWDSKRPIEPGWYAVSVNYRQGSIHSNEKTDTDSYRWLLNYRPFAQVGTSILIYHIPPGNLPEK